MCMNHTNKIECRQNKNNKTATTISPLEWAKENLEFELSFSSSLSLTRSLSVFEFSYDFFSWSQYARTHSVATHSHQAAYMHRYTTCRWIHTSHQVAAVCFFVHSFFCGPFVYAVFVFRRAWIDWNSYRYSQFQQNTCTELLFYQVTLHVQFHRIDSWNISHEKFFINIFDFHGDYSGLFLKMWTIFFC